VDKEPKLAGAAERLGASAFLARYKRFRYIETTSGMKMSDKQAIVRVGQEIVGANPSVPLLRSMNRANQALSPNEILRSERAASKIKSPNSVSRTYSNPLKTNDRDMLKSPKNKKWILSCSTFPRRAQQLSWISFPAFLTDTASQTETDVTCSKQTTEKFLTGARIAQLQTHRRAKMGAQISAKLSAQMKGSR
jgi:hypothetical protein